MAANPAALTTERLKLHALRPEDANDLFSVRGDAEAMRFWDWRPDETIDETRDMLARLLAEMQAGKAAYWTAREADGSFVGLFDLGSLTPVSAELGFMVARNHWGQGYATEAAAALVAAAARRGLQTLTARIHAGNEASRRLLLRLGFHPNGDDKLVEVAPGRQIMCAFFEHQP